MNIEKIGIIGLGAGGIATFVQLINESIKESKVAEIFLFDKKKNIGGLAYNTRYTEHILNLTPDLISLYPNKPNDFSEWVNLNKTNLKEKYPKVDFEKTQYLPRSIYGEYLKKQLEKTVLIAEQFGIIVHFIDEKVIHIKTNRKKYIISTTKQYQLDRVVLCTGHSKSSKFIEKKIHTNYIHNPWSDFSIPSDKSIGIIGSRLTAVDVLLKLKADGHKNKIYLLSRSGVLPTVIEYQPESYNLKYISKQKLESLDKNGFISLTKIIDLFKKEIESTTESTVNWNNVFNPKPSTKETLSMEIDLVQSGKSYKWRPVLKAIFPILSQIWGKLNQEDKNLFIKKYYSLLNAYEGGFPLVNAIKIHNLLDTNELCLVSGFNNAEHNPHYNRFTITYNEDQKLHIDYLINGTGSGNNMKISGSPLIKNLEKNKLVTCNPQGGIHMNISNLKVINENKHQQLYAIGELTVGDWLTTSSMPQIIKQAQIVAENLVD